MALDYIKHCIGTIKEIDCEELAQLMPSSPPLYGSSVSFRPLGILPDTGLWGGLKTPNSRTYRDAITRTCIELSQIALHVETTPDIYPHMPAFMGLIAVEGDDKGAVLVEDATENGNKDIIPTFMSDELRQMIYQPYKSEGDFEWVVSEIDCDNSVAFRVGEDERLLDFTPKPVFVDLFGLNGFRPIQDKIKIIEESLPQLTLTVPGNSPLGLSI